tara:strand:- start:785 stop:1321 length:537 start_codon:yes stop_codon:yes gene_type:complete
MKELLIRGRKKQGVMLLDDEDFEYLQKENIQLNEVSNRHTTYGVIIYQEYLGKINGEYKYKYIGRQPVHRLIMGLDDFKFDKRVINHIDGNGMNNQKSNLEISSIKHNSQSVNMPNRKKFGICYYDTSMKRKKRWRACFSSYGKRIQKRFSEKQQALFFLMVNEINEMVKNKRLVKQK